MSNKCPKCGKDIVGYPALSREDNKTKICSECGQKEAIEAMLKYYNKKEK